MSKIAFIGLGVMGHPMAGHLQKAGHDVTVYNRTIEKARGWQKQYGGNVAETPAEAAEKAEFVFSCVGNDHDLRHVMTSSIGAFQSLSAESIVIDHTTASADVARELYEDGKTKAIHFIDAPISGGQAGAENGQLTVMCGGDPESYAKAESLIGCFAKSCVHMGPSGSGQLAKMINQICIAGLMQGLAEGINFGQRAGLDMDKVIEVISKGAAQSWQMDNRASTMIRGDFDFGFAVEWMRKDLSFCLDESKKNGARLPVTALVDQFYAQVEARGGRRWDTSSLINLLNRD